MTICAINKSIRMHSDEIALIYAWELSGRIMTLEDFEPYEVFTKEIQEIVDRTLVLCPNRPGKSL